MCEKFPAYWRKLLFRDSVYQKMCSVSSSLSLLRACAHGVQIMAKAVSTDQRLAVLKPVERVGPEVSPYIVIRVLDDAPKGPEKIAYRLVQHYAVIKLRWHEAPAISLHHCPGLFDPQVGLYREVGKVPHGIVHSRILPIDEVDAFPHLHKVLWPGVIVAWSEG